MLKRKIYGRLLEWKRTQLLDEVYREIWREPVDTIRASFKRFEAGRRGRVPASVYDATVVVLPYLFVFVVRKHFA